MSALTNDLVVVGYWGIRGLAAPLRMMVLFHGGYKLQCENYDLLDKPEGGFDASAWFSKKPELKEKHPLINLPYIIDDGVVVTQSNACLQYLGRKLKMMGSNSLEETQCITEFLKSIESNKNGPMAKLNLWKSTIGSSSPAHFIGSAACAADFHIWEIVDQILSCAKFHSEYDTFATTFPALIQFHAAFGGLPQNSKYLSSALASLPQNNLMAAFGSTPTGEKFVPGQVCTWRGTSGVY